MSCLSASLTRVGGLDGSVIRAGGLQASVVWVGGLGVSVCSAGQLTGELTWMSDFVAHIQPVCSVNVTEPYLEIEPETIWLSDWGATNDVLSNTHWNVD